MAKVFDCELINNKLISVILITRRMTKRTLASLPLARGMYICAACAGNQVTAADTALLSLIGS